MDQLIQKLMKSKAIMEASDNIKRGGAVNQPSHSIDSVQEFNLPQVKYNIPQEFLGENNVMPNQLNSFEPRENTKPVGVPTIESIQKSKLPDEIKKLMMEHPIAQPQQSQMTISNELIEKASRLMKTSDNNFIPESAKQKQSVPSSQSINYDLIQKMINDAVENALKKSGLMVESSEKTTDTFTFRVGKHVFEGKISKVKKLS
jgi:hypothetical protein